MSAVTLLQVNGQAVSPWLDALAALRISVFRDWPYLYAGTTEYEARYLATYARSPRSLFVLALAGDTLIGCSTGVPLADEAEGFQSPWREAGHDVQRIFYFGESVLLPAFRGHGLGHRFFDAREAYAASLGGMQRTTFAAVDRDPADPRRPVYARDLAPFWSGRGYTRHDGLKLALPWAEVGCDDPEVPHLLTFWSRLL